MIDPNAALHEFITKFDAKPDWNVLIIEESKEVAEAVEHLLKELADLIYVVYGAEISNTANEALLENNPHFKTASKWLEGFAPEFGAQIMSEAFARVHASNMSKLDDNGNPIKRDDGKIMKGPNYAPPTLTDLVAA